jgi:hypothetical protein
MRIALLERFPEPSRRADVDRVAAEDDEVLLWDLARAVDESPPSLLRLVRRIPSWVTMPLPVRDRWRLLQHVTRTHAERRLAFERLPEWIDELHERGIDEVACYSPEGFDLVQWFAHATGRPARQMLDRGTKYFGEFAFEHLAVIPYAYWLYEQGRLEYTVSTPDTRCFYYFSPDHTEVAVDRRYVPITEYPIGEIDAREFDRTTFPEVIDTSQWSPPPYRDIYGDDSRFHWPKPPVIVCNKTSTEFFHGGRTMVNSLAPELLVAVVELLRDRYTVIYNRPRREDIVGDHDPIGETGDAEALARACPDVVMIQELHSEHPDLTFNELQLRLFAGSARFVSVLGGSSYLASYFGGTNVVYARRGWEVNCHAYDNWFDKFSGARVVAASTPRELLEAVCRELVEAPDGPGH